MVICTPRRFRGFCPKLNLATGACSLLEKSIERLASHISENDWKSNLTEGQREGMHFCYNHAPIAAVAGQRLKVPIQMCNCLQRGPPSDACSLLQPQDAEARRATSCNPSRWMLGCEQDDTKPHNSKYPNHTTEKWFTHAQKLRPSEGPSQKVIMSQLTQLCSLSVVQSLLGQDSGLRTQGEQKVFQKTVVKCIEVL